MRVEPLWMRLVPLKKGPQRAPLPLLPDEDTAKYHLWTWKWTPHQMLNSIGASPSLGILRNNFLFFLSYLVYLFVITVLNELGHMVTSKKAKCYRDKKTDHLLPRLGEERAWLQRHMKEFLWRDGNVRSHLWWILGHGQVSKTTTGVGRARAQACLPIPKESKWVPVAVHGKPISGPVLDLTPSCPSVWPSEGTQHTAPLSALPLSSCVAVSKSLSFACLSASAVTCPRELYTLFSPALALSLWHSPGFFPCAGEDGCTASAI